MIFRNRVDSLLARFFIIPIKAGIVKVNFSRGGRRSIWLTLFIFQEKLLQDQYDFIQMLSNLFKVGWRKNTDIICYMLTPLVCLQKGNVKKSKILMKLVNIGKKNLHIFQNFKNFIEILCYENIVKNTAKTTVLWTQQGVGEGKVKVNPQGFLEWK